VDLGHRFLLVRYRGWGAGRAGNDWRDSLAKHRRVPFAHTADGPGDRWTEGSHGTHRGSPPGGDPRVVGRPRGLGRVGDDAVLARTGGELVITTDVLVEGVHFVRRPRGARDAATRRSSRT
jgi:hypothetical protein